MAWINLPKICLHLILINNRHGRNPIDVSHSRPLEAHVEVQVVFEEAGVNLGFFIPYMFD